MIDRPITTQAPPFFMGPVEHAIRNLDLRMGRETSDERTDIARLHDTTIMQVAWDVRREIGAMQ